MKSRFLICLLVLLTSCHFEKITKGKDLSDAVFDRIKTLGLVEKEEKIILFYSNDSKEKAGSFFTDKRIAHYWLEQNKEKSDISFAYYRDVVSIQPAFQVSPLNCPYMIIKKKDGKSFRIYVDGTESEKNQFYQLLLNYWKKKKEGD